MSSNPINIQSKLQSQYFRVSTSQLSFDSFAPQLQYLDLEAPKISALSFYSTVNTRSSDHSLYNFLSPPIIKSQNSNFDRSVKTCDAQTSTTEAPTKSTKQNIVLKAALKTVNYFASYTKSTLITVGILSGIAAIYTGCPVFIGMFVIAAISVFCKDIITAVVKGINYLRKC